MRKNHRALTNLKQALAVVVAFTLCAGQIACGASPTENPAKYGPLPEQSAQICLPEQSGAVPRPLVILVHGGGWTSGNSGSLLSLCQMFARAGVVAATISYRLADILRPETRWPAQLDDVRLAAGWLRSKSKELHIDPHHVCVYGESAGAHLALWLGITDRNVACVIDAFGPSDLTALPRGKFDRAFIALFGTGYAEKNLREASPLFAQTRCWPPVFLAQGLDDDLVPPSQTERLAQRLSEEGAKTTADYYQGGHSWSGLSRSNANRIHARFIDAVKLSRREECQIGKS